MSKKKKLRPEELSLEERLGDTWANPFRDLKITLPDPEPVKSPEPPPLSPEERKKQQLSKEDQALLAAFGGGGSVPGSAAADAAPSLPKGPLLTFTIERKGRGGKTITLVHGLNSLETAAQMELCAKARTALGIGGRFVDGMLELQGDQRERAAKWFEKQGFRSRIP
ncbi:MAG: translation initiation factor [Lentisphaerae bacterium]|nr:translation initiation factor [Lentisphaerota bacterium]